MFPVVGDGERGWRQVGAFSFGKSLSLCVAFALLEEMQRFPGVFCCGCSLCYYLSKQGQPSACGEAVTPFLRFAQPPLPQPAKGRAVTVVREMNDTANAWPLAAQLL